MARVVITEPADADSTEIIRDLTAKAGELVADRYEADFDALYLRLAKFPESGSPRPKLGRFIRIGLVSPYNVIHEYVADDDGDDHAHRSRATPDHPPHVEPANHAPMIYGYARVSTDGQELDTGDELVIAEWDRATRSMWDGLQIIKAVIDAGASIKVLDRSYIDLETPMGRGFMAMMSAMAEDERLRIIKRTHEGRKIAQAKGVRMGASRTSRRTRRGSAEAHRRGRVDARPREELRGKRQHDFEITA